jgi:hypothetical protein
MIDAAARPLHRGRFQNKYALWYAISAANPSSRDEDHPLHIPRFFSALNVKGRSNTVASV